MISHESPLVFVYLLFSVLSLPYFISRSFPFHLFLSSPFSSPSFISMYNLVCSLSLSYPLSLNLYSLVDSFLTHSPKFSSVMFPSHLCFNSHASCLISSCHLPLILISHLHRSSPSAILSLIFSFASSSFHLRILLSILIASRSLIFLTHLFSSTALPRFIHLFISLSSPWARLSLPFLSLLCIPALSPSFLFHLSSIFPSHLTCLIRNVAFAGTPPPSLARQRHPRVHTQQHSHFLVA